ncbi:hypothetical protein CFN78_25565 [Amycolatopsis antarctica]|uniref:DUF4352 domain-containing protein n=2 Tax=Amycolatopsis antarctica TaxID=1854586 RepID=A0A263CVY6_9PSEU|nr:hypothetical protein CFN78_25565 [Amycolatopsis antarctica]
MRHPTVALALATIAGVVAGCASTTEGSADYTAWGHNTWPDGISIEVLGAQPCTPSSNAYPTGTSHGAIVSIKILNRSTTDYRVRDLAVSSPERAPGAAKLLEDPAGPCDSPLVPDEKVPPGQDFTFTDAYVLAPSGDLKLVLAPAHSAEPVTFAGTVPTSRPA